MADLVFNPYSKDSAVSQLKKHLQTNEYFKDVTNSISQQTKGISSIIEYQRKEMEKIVKTASKEQVLAIQESTNSVCGTLDDGFELLSNHFEEINYSLKEMTGEVNELASMLDERLSLVIEGQRITNILLGNIAILLRIPDFEKERQHFIEQGLKFFNNAIFDKDLFSYALTNFDRAIKIEPTDYFTLYRIGLICLYSEEGSIEKAEEYFRTAAKFAIAETHSGARVTNNYLTHDTRNDLLNQVPTIDSIKLQAAEAYMFAARTCYAQGKFTDAIDLAEKAFNLVLTFAEAGFIQAKALAANGNELQAANVVERVLGVDRFFALKISSDLDLVTKVPVRDRIEKLRLEAYNEASERLNKCKTKTIEDSKAKDLLYKIEKLTKRKTYLSCKKAIDLLDKKYKYTFEKAIIKNISGIWEDSIKQTVFSFTVEELIDYENLIKVKIDFVAELILKTQQKSSLLAKSKNVELEKNKKEKEIQLKRLKKSDWNILNVGCVTSLIVGVVLIRISSIHSGPHALNPHTRGGLALLGFALFFGGAIALFYIIYNVIVNQLDDKKLNQIVLNEKDLASKLEALQLEIKKLEKS